MEDLKKWLNQLITQASNSEDSCNDWTDKAYFIGMRSAFEDVLAFLEEPRTVTLLWSDGITEEPVLVGIATCYDEVTKIEGKVKRLINNPTIIRQEFTVGDVPVYLQEEIDELDKQDNTEAISEAVAELQQMW